MDRHNRAAGSNVAPTAPAAATNPYFTEGDPGNAIPATQPGPWWFHMMTEEIRAVIVAASLTPAHNVLTQLRDAILALIAASSGGFATNAEVTAGTVINKSVSPAGLLAGLLGAGGIGAADYITIPFRDKTSGIRRNLIVQWGISASIPAGGSIDITLPITFPTAQLVSIASRNSNSAGASAFAFWAYPKSLSEVSVYNGTASSGAAFFLVFGY